MKLTYKGRGYRGYDGDKVLDVKPGETVEVSEEKGKQLLIDYAGIFVAAGKVAEKVPEAANPPVAEVAVNNPTPKPAPAQPARTVPPPPLRIPAAAKPSGSRTTDKDRKKKPKGK